MRTQPNPALIRRILIGVISVLAMIGAGVGITWKQRPTNLFDQSVPTGDANRSTPQERRIAGSPKQEVAPQKAPVAEGCFTQSFEHEPIDSHDDGEECLKHRNLFTLNHEGVDASRIPNSAICVRVNGSPVKFTRTTRKPDQILIGPEAGPNAVVSIRYCLGKARCGDDCTIRKDEFLAAIGADSESVEAGWDQSAEGRRKDAQLETEMAALSRDLSGTNGGKSDAFRGWKRQAVAASSCPSRAIANAGK